VKPHNFYVEDNFISPEQCATLIRLYDKAPEVINKGKYSYVSVSDSEAEHMPMKHELVEDIWLRQSILANQLAGAITQWAQIYRWPEGSKMGLHNDVASRHTMYTSVLYLNDGFQGGETQLEDGTTIAPKTGRIFFYDGISYFHRVKPVTYGTRFTLASWYNRK
jgi:predicted 2-oxoglutarate/Fe(II)-dependent dioxygenase YbiX|tara:strand:- start:1069 stop:1560 length:492 start_codon:yes stop_codon:yes gene_type:complete